VPRSTQAFIWEIKGCTLVACKVCFALLTYAPSDASKTFPWLYILALPFSFHQSSFFSYSYTCLGLLLFVMAPAILSSSYIYHVDMEELVASSLTLPTDRPPPVHCLSSRHPPMVSINLTLLAQPFNPKVPRIMNIKASTLAPNHIPYPIMVAASFVLLLSVREYYSTIFSILPHLSGNISFFMLITTPSWDCFHRWWLMLIVRPLGKPS
jgi:hypothetical protein